MKIILIGPPGSGKGSQASLISKNFNLSHISTGNMFREIMKEKTYLGRQVKQYMDQAKMVPDHLAIQVVENKLSKNEYQKGFILDGYPRTLKQAEELDEIIDVDIALFLDVSTKELTDRILSRVICTKCGEVYSTRFYKGKFCLICGNPLEARKDDKLDIVYKRIADFETLTLPVVEYYKKKGKLKTVKGDCSIEKMFLDVKDILTKEL